MPEAISIIGTYASDIGINLYTIAGMSTRDSPGTFRGAGAASDGDGLRRSRAIATAVPFGHISAGQLKTDP